MEHCGKLIKGINQVQTNWSGQNFSIGSTITIISGMKRRVTRKLILKQENNFQWTIFLFLVVLKESVT